MTEDELIDKMAREMAGALGARVPYDMLPEDASQPRLADGSRLTKEVLLDGARVALAAIREAVGDPLTLVAHIRQLEADNKDFLEQIAVQTESVLFKELQEIMKANNALHDENARLKQLVDFADALRAAQRAYMADRGNDQLGRAVANAAKSYDDLRSLGGVRSDE